MPRMMLTSIRSCGGINIAGLTLPVPTTPSQELNSYRVEVGVGKSSKKHNIRSYIHKVVPVSSIQIMGEQKPNATKKFNI